jgi:hypothetical protein
MQKAFPSIKILKAHHPKHFHPNDHNNECSNKISIHLDAHEKCYPKDDTTMDVKCVPQYVLGNETTPIMMSIFDQLGKIDLLTTCLLSKTCFPPST